MQRDEEDAVVVAEDRVGPVAVMDVVVDDRDALEAERALRGAGRDRDVVEEAEAHRPVLQGVMPGRAHERETAAERRLDRGARREHRRLVGRGRSDGVGGDPRAAGERLNAGEVLRGVAEEQLLLCCYTALDPIGEVLEEDGEPLAPLGVLARRVQAGERGVGQEVDRTVSSSSSSDAPPARARPTR